MNLGHLFQSFSMLCFGVGNTLWKFPQANAGIFRIIATRSFITVLLFGASVFIANSYVTDLRGWLIAVFISAISFWGLVFYNLAIKHSTVSQTIIVTTLCGLFGVITSLIVYDETFRWTLIFSFILLVFGLILVQRDKIKLQFNKATIYALSASLFWGVTFALFRIPIELIGELNFSFCLEFSVCVSALIFFMITGERSRKSQLTTKNYMTILILSLLGFGGVLFYNLAATLAPMSEISLMGIFTPVITIVISHFLLKERFTLIQYAGMLIMISGALLLAL